MEDGDLEPRVSALENQMDAVREDAEAARILAAAADRDVGEIRGELRDFRQATVGSINALREDIVDLRRDVDRRFEQVDRRFEQVDRRFEQVDRNFEQVARNFEQVDRNFDEVRGKFEVTAAGQRQIISLLEILIDRDAGGR